MTELFRPTKREKAFQRRSLLSLEGRIENLQLKQALELLRTGPASARATREAWPRHHAVHTLKMEVSLDGHPVQLSAFLYVRAKWDLTPGKPYDVIPYNPSKKDRSARDWSVHITA